MANSEALRWNFSFKKEILPNIFFKHCLISATIFSGWIKKRVLKHLMKRMLELFPNHWIIQFDSPCPSQNHNSMIRVVPEIFFNRNYLRKNMCSDSSEIRDLCLMKLPSKMLKMCHIFGIWKPMYYLVFVVVFHFVLLYFLT